MGVVLMKAVSYFFQFLQIAIMVRVVMSWFPLRKAGAFTQLVYVITEPILSPIRSLLSRWSFTSGMMIDFSPIVAYILMSFLYRLILGIAVTIT